MQSASRRGRDRESKSLWVDWFLLGARTKHLKGRPMKNHGFHIYQNHVFLLGKAQVFAWFVVGLL